MKYTKEYIDDINIINKIKNIDHIDGANILVTGARGTIGSCVVDMLCMLKENNKNIKIVCAGRNIESIKKRFSNWLDSYTYIKYDATLNLPLQDKYDFIIHCASNANPVFYTENPVNTILSNIIGTNVVFNSYVPSKYGNCIYISTSEVYGKLEAKKIYKEDDYGFVDILSLRSTYPNAKRLAETLCIAHIKEFNSRISIARPGHIYGPTFINSDTRVSAEFARRASKKENIILKSKGQQLRSYCYVCDCASAILYILLNGKSGEAYNISDKNSIISIYQLAEYFSSASNVKIVYSIPDDNDVKRFNVMESSALDSTKLENLGWEPITDITSGVKKTLDMLALNSTW